MLFRKILTNTLVAASVSFGGMGTALAAPMATPFTAQAAQQGNVVDVQYRHDKHRRGFYRRDGNPYYNGRRGYRHPRPGYREYNGFWFPAAAFTLGLLLAPQVVPQQRVYHLSPAHYRWCDDHYKSYRRRDNSWQPYHGPRRQCISPFIR